MWWLIVIEPDFWGRGPGLQFPTMILIPDALHYHCEGNRPLVLRLKNIFKIYIYLSHLTDQSSSHILCHH